MSDDDYITNWHGKPINYLTRGELVDALDWCVKELRKHNEDYHHQSPRVTAGNCDSLFKVGDKGQRFEVRAMGMQGQEFVVGWTERPDGGGLAKRVEKHPVWTLSRIIDRQTRVP